MKKVKQKLSALNRNIKSYARSYLLYLLGDKASAVLVEGDRYRMLVDVADGSVSRQWLRNGCYNPEEISSLLKLLDPTDSLLLLGAHIGSLVIPLSESVRAVTAFEPNPQSHKLCRLNIALSETKNITLHNYAAGDSNACLGFVAAKVNSGGSKRMPIDNIDNYLHESNEVISVTSVVLDEFLINQEFSVVFADIEGGEYFAFRGAQRILREAEILIFEFRPHHLRDVAGISTTDFLASIPLEKFSHFIVPRLRGWKAFPISKLQSVLDAMQQDDHYEDNVILLSKLRGQAVSKVLPIFDYSP